MPTERWKLIGVHIQSVLWACPFFDTQRNILFIYSIDCCCIHFESGCACFWRNMGLRSAFTLFIKHLFCSQYLIELYLEFIGFLGLLLFFSRIFLIVQIYMQRLWRFFFCWIKLVFIQLLLLLHKLNIRIFHWKSILCLCTCITLYIIFNTRCTTKVHGLPFYYPYVMYQLATKTFCLWF